MKDLPYHYNVTITRVIDGDTFVADIDLGFNLSLKDQRLRLMGINTPETRGDNKWKGVEAMSFVEEALDQVDTVIKSFKRDSFGRVLCTLYYQDYETKEWVDLNQQLLDTGHAVPYKK